MAEGFAEPPSVTLKEQQDVELTITRLYAWRKRIDGEQWEDKHRSERSRRRECIFVLIPARLTLLRPKHVAYLLAGLNSLSGAFTSLDASRPWLVYWILHALELLHALPAPQRLADVVNFLGAGCQCVDGGFAGGPGQRAHLAPTYAAMSALAIVGTPAAFNVVDRQAMYRFLLDLKFSTGSFSMERGGEVDVRASYCALVVATLLNIRTPELEAGMADWIASCQTYEGGFGAEPGCEAHGGYTFCAFAALRLLKATHKVDLKRLRRWTIERQGVEGGFNGRTNKLVDGCYSFWIGALWPLLDMSDGEALSPSASPAVWGASPEALQRYVLACCQDDRGGLLDKPGKSRDFYHTCYTLSGLSLAQRAEGATVLGVAENLLAETDPIFNIGPDKVQCALEFFQDKPFVPASS